MDGFERRKEQKKESIRRAAIELFQSYGFKKVSVNDIAKRAGVSPVTIYNHFENKEALVRDVMKWYITGLFEKYKGVIEKDMPFREKLEFLVFDKSEIASQFQGELIRTILESDPELHDFFENLYTNRMVPMVESFFEEGRQQGYIDRRFSTETMLLYFEVLRRGFFSLPGISERAEHDPKIMKELIELMTYGLNG